MNSDLNPGARAIANEAAVPTEAVPSPCISVCQMNDNSGLCLGCLRTMDEIVLWSEADDDYKRAVWAKIVQREEGMQDFDDIPRPGQNRR